MSHSLTETDKERIRLEEVYRKEIRDQLANKSSWKDFLNSSFSIAILGAMLAGAGALLTTLGTYYVDSRKEASEHKERAKHIAREIEYRCALFAEDKELVDKARGLNGGLPKSVAYSAYEGTKLFPLLVELESLVASDADKNEIASLSEKCCTDFSSLDETKLKDIATHAKTIAQQILAN
jgi:hypothetical protein